MKIRIGFGLGTNSHANDPTTLGPLIDDLERLGYDSVWFAERVAGATLDPVVAMTYAAARTNRLKFGPSVMVVPGRNPVLLAKSLASLDRISDGRLLPAFGLGAVNLGEHQAFGVERKERSAWFDEAVPLLRRLWTEDLVDHHGERFNLDGVRVRPAPIQKPLDIWLGGIAPSELRRTGRLGDGWLPSFCGPADVAAGIPVINQHAADNERAIDEEHIGALVAYTIDGSVPDRIVEAIKLRRPDVDPLDIIVTGRDGLAPRIEEFVDAGASKFVIMPFTEPDDWTAELDALAEAVLHIQT
ncbi:MAG: TIGR03619 family F420-dependent LLM class oxidoreductase [Acidimicrobiia bacterium]|nr:TIGR03619 family F420-dependent LLM class oxidoreductase [Acidimicrobiia bacterium]